MRTFLSLLIIIFSLQAFAQSKNDDLTFLIDGAKKKVVSIKEIRGFSPKIVEFYDYTFRTSTNFRGTSFFNLINYALPDQLDKTAEVEFISQNGYRSYFTVDSFYKLEAILAYEAESGPFERFSKKDKKIVPLGPYYLLWNFKSNQNELKLKYNSSYQVNSINLITSAVDLGVKKIKDNDSSITVGFRAYKRYCLSCHAIGSWGGNISDDLVKKKTIEVKGADFIKNYVFDSDTKSTHKEFLNMPKYKNSKELVEGIIYFLKFSSNPELYLKPEKSETNRAQYDDLKNIMIEIDSKKSQP